MVARWARRIVHTSCSGGRSAIRAIRPASCGHSRPQDSSRAASAITCDEVLSSRGAFDGRGSAGGAGLLAGAAGAAAAAVVAVAVLRGRAAAGRACAGRGGGPGPSGYGDHGRVATRVRASGQRNVPFDILGADQVGKERHQLECFGELGIATRQAVVCDAAQLEQSRARMLDQPARRALVCRPVLGLCVLGVVECAVARVPLDTRVPAVEQLRDSFVCRAHGVGLPLPEV